ncbi:hypothetical protein VQ042_20805 [Aurantimonas sp. A2-1-M11]|uniref:hypothetical protein n=1 Tax=Aurantimonas sp. A2-1-M11 TaxID=3113712 RepID=UPI002F920678
MGKFGKFLRSLFRALSTTGRIPVVVAGETIGWVWRLIAGGSTPAGDPEQVVEVPDAKATLARTAAEEAAAEGSREKREAAIAATQLPKLVKNACDVLDAGGQVNSYAFNSCEAGNWLFCWVRSLTESQRRTIRHMPDATLVDHLSGHVEQLCLPSYRHLDLDEANERIAEIAEAERTRGWSALERFADFIDQAVYRGDVHLVDHLALWIRAQRLAGVDEEDLDFGPYGPD